MTFVLAKQRSASGESRGSRRRSRNVLRDRQESRIPMCHRIAQVVFPCGSPADPLVMTSTWRVPVSAAGPSIYDTVDFCGRVLFRGRRGALEHVDERIPLRNIVTLHNLDGIRDVAQIKGMIRQIRDSGDILHSTGLPNVKLVRTTRGDRVLFDGHHSILAYVASGRDHLDEIPHLVVHDGEGWVTDVDILVFFGPHARELTESTWREHVVNWQAPYDRQVCRRMQQDAGELFDSLVTTGALPARTPAGCTEDPLAAGV
jgi:hypothetical protein